MVFGCPRVAGPLEATGGHGQLAVKVFNCLSLSLNNLPGVASAGTVESAPVRASEFVFLL